VEWDKDSPIRYKVRGRDIGRYTVWVTTNAAGDTVSDTSAYLPAHGASHSFNKLTGVGGGDIVWVYSDQFMPWAVTPSGSAGSLSIAIQPSAYYYNNQFRWAGGTGIAGFENYYPTGSSNARMLLIYLDPDTGNPYIATGTLTEFANTITGTQQIMPYMPSLIEETDIPLAGVRLITGTSKILWQNLYDLRDYFAHASVSGSSGGGGAPTDAQYVTMALDGDLSAERVLTAGADVTLTDGGANGNATVGVTTGSFSRPGHTHTETNTLLIYDDSVFKGTGTAISFDDNLTVSVTGSILYVDGQAGSSGGGYPIISEDSVFKATGVAIDFGENMNVAVTGSTVFVSSVDTTGGGGGDLLIYDNDVFQVTGTALDFGNYLNVSVTGSIAYISSPFSPTGFDIGARVYSSTGTIISHNTTTTIAFDSERYDTNGIHSGSSSQLYCNTAGKYIIHGQVEFADNQTGVRNLYIQLNRTTYLNIINNTPSPASFPTRMEIATITDLDVGDYVELRAFQNSGGDLSLVANDQWSIEFSMHKIDGGGNAIQVYDDSVFVATGTAISFDEGLDVVSTGTTAYVGLQDIGASVYNTGTAITAAAVKTVTFDQEVYDTDGIHSGSSSQFYCNTAGKYLVSFQGVINFTPTSVTDDGVWIEHNTRGRVAQQSIYNARSFTLSKIINLSVGDYLVVKIYSANVSGKLIYSSGNEYSPFFEIQRLA